MRRIFAMLVTILLLFSGCGGSDDNMDRALKIRDRVLGAENCSFDVVITADYGDKFYEFAMSCQGDTQGNLSFQVTAPETLTGITGNVSASGGKLTFDDQVIALEHLTEDLISPISGPWVFYNTLRSGYIASAGEEDGNLRLAIDDSFQEDALRLDIWLDSSDLPIRGEILHDGRRILTLQIKNFALV